MPCYDPRPSSEPEIVYLKGCSPAQLESAQSAAIKMEAMVCALLNELDRRGIAEQVIAEASRNGLIDIMGFWAVHKKDDISRIADDIHHRYSKDEQEVIRKLLSAKK